VIWKKLQTITSYSSNVILAPWGFLRFSGAYIHRVASEFPVSQPQLRVMWHISDVTMHTTTYTSHPLASPLTRALPSFLPHDPCSHEASHLFNNRNHQSANEHPTTPHSVVKNRSRKEWRKKQWIEYIVIGSRDMLIYATLFPCFQGSSPPRVYIVDDGTVVIIFGPYNKTVSLWQKRIAVELPPHLKQIHATPSASWLNYRYHYSFQYGYPHRYTRLAHHKIYRLYRITVHWTLSTTARSQSFQRFLQQMAQVHIPVGFNLGRNKVSQFGCQQTSRAEYGHGMLLLPLNPFILEI